jgi:CheY-like chemotaxis protein
VKRSRVLVVDDSTLVREMLATVLAPHCAEVITAESVADAKGKLTERGDVHILLSDIILPDGDGFELLQHALDLNQVPSIRVILMTGRPQSGHEARALEMGAIGYLEKPIALDDVLHALTAGLFIQKRQHERSHLLGKAVLRDPTRESRPVVRWQIRDISRAGAFLETTAPVPDGTLLDLLLILGHASFRAEATVVRVQQPSWAKAGGVGVYFSELSEHAEKQLEQFLGTVPEPDLVG